MEMIRGKVDAALARSKGIRDRQEIVSDLVKWLARENWTDEEINTIYTAVCNRMRGKTCTICDKWAPIYGGDYTYPGGDMSKPKQFRCGACLEALK